MPVNDENSSGLLRALDITKSLRGQEVVMGISLEIGRGEIVALLGPNGAGKSTLISVMTGVQRPDYGTVEIDGVDVTGLPIYARAQLGLSYLPQDSSVFRGLSVEDNILLYLESYEPDRALRYERLEDLLDEFGLMDVRTRSGAKLSGGERRRCEIARALAANPNYILLDEPFAGVDPLAIADIKLAIAKLGNRGIGVLISDHNVRETLSMVGHAYIMESGRLLASGAPDAIAADESVRYFYLGDSLNN